MSETKEGEFGEPWSHFVWDTTITEMRFSNGETVRWEPDIRRAVTCVNAFAGIEDPAAYLEELREKARQYEELCK